MPPGWDESQRQGGDVRLMETVYTVDRFEGEVAVLLGEERRPLGVEAQGRLARRPPQRRRPLAVYLASMVLALAGGGLLFVLCTVTMKTRLSSAEEATRAKKWLHALATDSLRPQPWADVDSVVGSIGAVPSGRDVRDSVAARALFSGGPDLDGAPLHPVWDIDSTAHPWAHWFVTIQWHRLSFHKWDADTSIDHDSVWGILPDSLPQWIRSELVAGASAAMPLDAWRRVARSGALPPLLSYKPGFPGVADVWSIPGWTSTRVQGIAERNADAAILATERGDIVTARLRMAENARVGWHLMRSPLESEHYLGTRILDHARHGLAEIGRITGDSAATSQAQLLAAVLARFRRERRLATRVVIFLSADPDAEQLDSIVANQTLAPVVRWEAMAGVAVSWCFNAREVLLGVSPRRDSTVVRVAASLSDLPRSDDYVALVRRSLDRMSAGAELPVYGEHSAAVRVARALRLRGLANRLAFCEG